MSAADGIKFVSDTHGLTELAACAGRVGASMPDTDAWASVGHRGACGGLEGGL